MITYNGGCLAAEFKNTRLEMFGSFHSNNSPNTIASSELGPKSTSVLLDNCRLTYIDVSDERMSDNL